MERPLCNGFAELRLNWREQLYRSQLTITVDQLLISTYLKAGRQVSSYCIVQARGAKAYALDWWRLVSNGREKGGFK
jgi:hypothetical protein